KAHQLLQRLRLILQEFAKRGYAGICYRDGKLAELFYSLVDQILYKCNVAYITGNGLACTAIILYSICSLYRQLIIYIIQNNRSALPRQLACYFKTYALPGPGYYGHLAVEFLFCHYK